MPLCSGPAVALPVYAACQVAGCRPKPRKRWQLMMPTLLMPGVLATSKRAKQPCTRKPSPCGWKSWGLLTRLELALA